MDASISAEIAWVQQAADVLKAAGPYGVIAVMGYVIRTLWTDIQARDVLIASLQDKRAEDSARSADRLATVATTGSTAIAANTNALAENNARLQFIRDAVLPLREEHGRIISAVDRNGDKMDDLTTRVGTGCRA